MKFRAGLWDQSTAASVLKEIQERRKKALAPEPQPATAPCQERPQDGSRESRPRLMAPWAAALSLLALSLLPTSLLSVASTDETKSVSTLATVPLGQLFNDNSYTPVASYRGATYFVWLNSDNRPKVGMVKNGVLSSAYLSSNSAYTIRNDGHHYFSLGVDKDGYIHVTGDMHNYPATDMSYYPSEYKDKLIMYWVSRSPESVATFDFVGGDAARAITGYGFGYHSFQYDQDRNLYFLSRVKVHRGGHKPGEMGLGFSRYDTATRSWTSLGGYAPSSPAAIYKSLVWEDNGDSDTGGWYQGFRAGARFDLNDRLHFAATVFNNSSLGDPSDVLYGRSDDRGLTYKRGDGSSVLPPLRVDPVASQGDLVAGPGRYDLFASVGFNRQGSPWVGYSEFLDRQTFRYKYRLPGSGWSAPVNDPFGTYIRSKYHLDANGVMSFFGITGQYRRQEDYASAGYNGAVGINNSYICIEDMALRENNEHIGISKGTGNMSVVRLRLDPKLSALPAPWTPAPLGTVASPVSGQFYGAFTLGGASAGLAGTSDSMQWARQSVSGDVDLRIRVISLAWSTDAASAGLVLRQGTAPGAPMAAAAITYKQGAKLLTRASTSASVISATKAGHTAAEWLRLVRSGSTVTAYRSDNGATWQLIATATVPFSGSLEAGFFQASGDPAIAGTARFDSFSMSAAPAFSPTRTSVVPASSPTSSPVPPTRSSTRTFTRTPTPLSTFTATPTASPSSEQGSATFSPTVSLTHSGEPSPETETGTFSPTRTATRTRTPVPASTHTRTATPRPTFTRTPTPAPTSSASLEVFHQTTDPATATGPHHKLQLKNKSTSSLNLATVELRYWLDCDCGAEGLQAFIDWAGFPAGGQSLTATITPKAFSGSGQTHFLSIKFSTGTLPAGALAEVQLRFNRGNWAAMTQADDYSYAAHPSLISWPKAAAYVSGAKAWGSEPQASGSGGTASLEQKSSSSIPSTLMLVVAPNPADGPVVARLALPEAGRATLDLRDLSGALVHRLDLGPQPAGWQDQPMNLSHLAPGLYMAVLELEVDALETRRTVFKLGVK